MEEKVISNKKYFVAPLNSSKAYQFICAYHYSHVGFKKASLNLGVFDKTNNLLVGVMQWGCSAQTKIRLDHYVKNTIKIEEYLELNRFAMADSEIKNSESQAISLGIKWIKKYKPNIRLLVSYSGRIEGNYGYIYQATNWEYLGYFISNGFWKLDGLERHMITIQLNYKKHGAEYKNIVDYLIHNYNNVSRYDSKQFIYIMRLDKKLIPAVPILPYPKPKTEYPIQTNEKIYKKTDEINTISQKYEHPSFYYNPNELLFSKRCLERKGELIKEEYIYAIYNKDGKLEGVFNSVSEINAKMPKYLSTGIHNAIKTLNPYKEKYFRKYLKDSDYDKEIKVKILCWIDNIPYYSQKDLVKDLGVSRQAVSACIKRKGKTLGGRKVTWELEEN